MFSDSENHSPGMEGTEVEEKETNRKHHAPVFITVPRARAAEMATWAARQSLRTWPQGSLAWHSWLCNDRNIFSLQLSIIR